MKLLLIFFCATITTCVLVSGFFVTPSSFHKHRKTSTLNMGFFDSLGKAFSNAEYAAPPEGIKATARHILVKSPEALDEVMAKIASGETGFGSLAANYSTCPSGARGGSLGSFSPGTMVKEFDDVIFSKDTALGEVVGPVQTKFGYHLVVVDKRTGV